MEIEQRNSLVLDGGGRTTGIGIAAGLPANLAEQLARATLAGAGERLRLSFTMPAGLRASAGTTEVALKVSICDGLLLGLLARTVVAVIGRTRKLAG